MNSPQVSLVLACGNDGQVGINDRLPWNIPEELQHFKELTSGHAIIMGRKTFESIGRPLPGRQNIVISRKLTYLPGVTIATSLQEALYKVDQGRIAYIIGGVSLWMESIKRADSAIITMVDYDGPADVNLPDAFFEDLRNRFRLDRMKRKTGFSITEWLKGIKKS